MRPIEILVTSDAETLDPRYVVDAVGLRASRLVHAGLVRLDPTSLEPVPYLASSWTWVDARTLRVALREDVHFHSGAPLTPRDVVATLHAFASPTVGSRHARVVEAIESAVEDGAHTVVIRMKRPHATLLTDLELPILRADEAAGPPDPAGHLDGLGPYAVDHVSHGEISLIPKGDTLPLPKRSIVIRTVHDENARALRLIAGRSDIGQNVFSPTLLPALAARSDLKVVSRSGANLTYLLARVDRGTLADVHLREAISLAIDRPTITRTLLAGYAQPARSLLPPNHWAHTEEPDLESQTVDVSVLHARELEFDPGAARARVKAPVAMTLLTSTDRARISIARVIAQELAEVGIAAEVIPLELGTMIARLNAGDFDAAILQLPEITEPNVFRVFMHSTYIPPAGANRARLSDPEIDALLDEGDRVTDRDVRKAAYAKLEVRARQTLAMIPLWHEDHVVVAGPRAQAFMPSAEGRWLSVADLP